MNIEKLAREAGWTSMVIDNLQGTEDHKRLQRLAALIRAEVLEEAAAVCDGVYHQNIGPGYGEVRYGISSCAAAIRALKDRT